MIVGIDQSTRVTGFAVFRHGQIILLENIKTNAGYLDMVARILIKIEELPGRPDIIFLETVYLGINRQTMRKLANLEGALYYALQDYNVMSVAPAAVSSWLGIPMRTKREDKKRITRAMAWRYVSGSELQIDTITDDQADAMIIALAGMTSERVYHVTTE